MIFDKLISDIHKEKSLWSSESTLDASEKDSVWRRVANNNNLTVVEVKLIFRELEKKYKEECKKSSSTWKLLEQLRFLDETAKNDPKDLMPLQSEIKTEPEVAAQNTSDDDIYIELLEVKEEDLSDDDDAPIAKDTSKNEDIIKEIQREIEGDLDSKTDTIETSVVKRTTSSKSQPGSPKMNTNASRRVPASLLKNPQISVKHHPKRKYTNGSIENKSNGSIDSGQPVEKVQRTMSSGITKRSNSTPTTSQHDFPLNFGNSTENSGNTDKQSVLKQTAASTVNCVAPIEVVGMETNTGIKIGDVIQLTNTDIKMEKPDGAVDSILNSILTKDIETQLTKSEKELSATPQTKMYNSFGDYIANTLNALPEKLASKLEIKILEDIISVNSERY